MHRLNVPEGVNPEPLTPVVRTGSGAAVGHLRVAVAHVDGEEFEEAQNDPSPGARDECRKQGHGLRGDEFGVRRCRAPASVS